MAGKATVQTYKAVMSHLACAFAVVVLFYTSAVLLPDTVFQRLEVSQAARALSSPANHRATSFLQEAEQHQQYFCDRVYPQLMKIGTTNSTTMKLASVDGSFGWEKFEMYVIPQKDIVSNRILALGAWEGKQTKSFIEMMDAFGGKHGLHRSQMTFVDIGSNIGWLSQTVANFGFNVIAFEPMQMNEMIQRSSLCHNQNLAYTKRVTLTNLGLGEATKKCTIMAPKYNLGDGHVFCDNVPEDPGFVSMGSMQTTMLDELFDGIAINPLIDTPGALYIPLLKMDTEGFELFVLRGAQKMLKENRIPYLFVEFFIYAERHAETYAILRNFGYEMSIEGFHGKPWAPAPYDATAPPPRREVEVYCWLVGSD